MELQLLINNKYSSDVDAAGYLFTDMFGPLCSVVRTFRQFFYVEIEDAVFFSVVTAFCVGKK